MRLIVSEGRDILIIQIIMNYYILINKGKTFDNFRNDNMNVLYKMYNIFIFFSYKLSIILI